MWRKRRRRRIVREGRGKEGLGGEDWDVCVFVFGVQGRGRVDTA